MSADSDTNVKASSISVAVRVRPFTTQERQHLIQPTPENLFQSDGALTSGQVSRSYVQPKGLRKILNVVDDRMLVFDPAETNQLNKMVNSVFANNNVNDNNNRMKGGRSPQNRVSSRIREHRFVFDSLFDEEATQDQVYNGTTQPLLDSIIDGFNATVFAYGATGCGKTHTITGTNESPGIIFSTMKELFDKIEQKEGTHNIDVTLSYLEIYNESIRDLLFQDEEGKPLHIREDQSKRITVSNLSSFKPDSVDQVMDLIMMGNANRTISPTEANATSSRSHAVLQINVDSKPRSSGLTEEHTFATLSIIDLAGSERASSTKNTGERLHEGANINRSLLALGNCINALCDPRRRNHVPYRDSKLTRLLKFSLGGNCKTVMIVCVSPSSAHYDETLNTLKYANRAKEIKTKVIRNQHNLSRHVGSYLKMITEQKQEIEELRHREQKQIQQALMRQALQKEKIQKLLFEGLDELTNSISKHSHIRRYKAMVLAKRKLLTVLHQDLDNFLKSFDVIFKVDEDEDLAEYDSLVPGFSAVLHKAETLLTKFVMQIEELERAYTKETELDHILENSSKSIVKRLCELEGWTSYDSISFDLHVDKLKFTVERDVLYESSVIFDQSVTALNSLDFSFINFFSLFKECLMDREVKIESLKKLVLEMSGKFDYLLQKDIELNLTEPLQKGSLSSTVVPPLSFSPRKQKSKRSPSPLNRSPAKVSKPRSPIRARMHKVKKVRWEIPSNDYSSDDSDDNQEEISDNLQDVEMKDTPLHEKLWEKMNISPSRSNNNIILRNFKNNSLTSRKLVPPGQRDLSSIKLDSHVQSSTSSIGVPTSPNKGMGKIGPPQRVFQPLRPTTKESQESSTDSSDRDRDLDMGPPLALPAAAAAQRKQDNKDIEKTGNPTIIKKRQGEFDDTSSVVIGSDLDNGVNKENSKPVSSVFGDISSIF